MATPALLKWPSVPFSTGGPLAPPLPDLSLPSNQVKPWVALAPGANFQLVEVELFVLGTTCDRDEPADSLIDTGREDRQAVVSSM